MTENLPNWVSILIAVLGLGGGGVLGYLLKAYSTVKDEYRKDTEFSVQLYKDYISQIKAEQEELKNAMQTLENENVKCRIQNAELKLQLKQRGG